MYQASRMSDLQYTEWSCPWMQVGQFLGARGDIVPEAVWKQLSKLHDQVSRQLSCDCRHHGAQHRLHC